MYSEKLAITILSFYYILNIYLRFNSLQNEICFYKDWCNRLKDAISGYNCSHLVTLQHSSDNFFVHQDYSIWKDNRIRHYHF